MGSVSFGEDFIVKLIWSLSGNLIYPCLLHSIARIFLPQNLHKNYHYTIFILTILVIRLSCSFKKKRYTKNTFFSSGADLFSIVVFNHKLNLL